MPPIPPVWRTSLLAAAIILSACGDREASTSAALAERAAALAADSATDTLVVEGVPQAVAFREVRGSSFPLPFEVRIPEPMAVGTEVADGRAAFRVTQGAAAGGGLWSVVVLPKGTTEADARLAAQTTAEAQGTATDAEAPPAAALAAFATARDDRSGSVWIGRHAGQFFLVVTDVSAAVAEGFAPRAAYLVEHWRWLDDGSALAG